MNTHSSKSNVLIIRLIRVHLPARARPLAEYREADGPCIEGGSVFRKNKFSFFP